MTSDLKAVRADIASHLAEGASSRHSAFHSPVVATADADLRVMVLRGFDAGSWTLRFHTDLRSPKVALIGEGAPVGVLGYDRKAKLQLRCRGTGRIEHDTPAVDAAWAESTAFARRCYLGEGPGTASEQPTSGLPDWAEGTEPTEAQVAPGRAHFAILLVQLETVDWFHLAHTGHRRAVWDVAADEGRWITP